MLASVLNSPSAIAASIYVVRAFVKLREVLSMHHELSEKISDLERWTFEKLDEHSDQLLLVFRHSGSWSIKNKNLGNRLGLK